MNPDKKEMWVDSLRKSEVNGEPVVQTKGYLRVEYPDGPVGLCCLGVLTELAMADGVGVRRRELGDDGFVWEFQNSDSEWVRFENEDLPDPVAKWAGLDSANPFLTNDKGIRHHASIWNDDEGATFEQIADLVEVNL